MPQLVGSAKIDQIMRRGMPENLMPELVLLDGSSLLFIYGLADISPKKHAIGHGVGQILPSGAVQLRGV
jgi:hypothetical protein